MQQHCACSVGFELVKVPAYQQMHFRCCAAGRLAGWTHTAPECQSPLDAGLNAIISPTIAIWCRVLKSPSDMTTKTIIQRIIVNSQAYEARQAKKLKSEQAYYQTSKAYVEES